MCGCQLAAHQSAFAVAILRGISDVHGCLGHLRYNICDWACENQPSIVA